MRKLHLNLEALDVETFYMDDAVHGAGTIRGRMENEDSPAYDEDYATAGVTCTSGPCIQSKNSPDCWTKVTSACKQGGSCWDACVAEPVEPVFNTGI